MGSTMHDESPEPGAGATHRWMRIINYHSVGGSATPLSVSDECFDQQMEFLSTHFDIVRLSDMVRYVLGRASLREGSVAITFDDGYEDNLSSAAPILKRYNAPATIFIATDFVGKHIPLYGRLLPALSWAQIREWSETEQFDVGAHTDSHPRLADTSDEAAMTAIRNSKVEIEARIGREVEYFSYPHGSFNKRTVKMVRDSGFRAACGGSGAIHRSVSPFRLRRFQVEAGMSLPSFMTSIAREGVSLPQTVKDRIDRFLDLRS